MTEAAFILPWIALAIPVFIYYIWLKSESVLYSGVGLLQGATRYVPMTGSRAYVFIKIPTYEELVRAEVDKGHIVNLGPEEIPVRVQVRQRIFGSPWVSLLMLERGQKPLRGGAPSAGLLVGIYYMLAGLFFLLLDVGWASGLGFAVSGLSNSTFSLTKLRRTDLGNEVLGILGAFLVLLGIAVFGLFQHKSAISIVLGPVLAYAFGQVLGMLLKAFQPATGQGGCGNRGNGSRGGGCCKNDCRSHRR